MIIAFTAWNRPYYLRDVLASWRAVEGIGDCLLTFHVEPGCSETLDVISEVDFADWEVVKNNQVYGPLTNPWRALDNGFRRDEFVVLAEDDSTVAPDLLTAFDRLRSWTAELPVLALCAFQIEPGQDRRKWRIQRKFHSTVWGTWRDRWTTYLRDQWDHDYSRRGWDWDIQEHVLPDNGLWVVAPEMSRSQHIGRDAGVHCTPEMFAELQAPTPCWSPPGSYVLDTQGVTSEP